MGTPCCKPPNPTIPTVNADIKDNQTNCCDCDNMSCCVTIAGGTQSIERKKTRELESIDKQIKKLETKKVSREHYYNKKLYKRKKDISRRISRELRPKAEVVA